MAEKPSVSAERTLADIVGGIQNLQVSCGWLHGDTVLNELSQRLHKSEILDVLHEVEDHIATMGIADRFSRQRFAGQLMVDSRPDPQLDRMDITFGEGEKLNEAGYKRATLLLELQAVRNQLFQVFSRLGILRLDIEATNMNDDGAHVATPSKDTIRAGNLLSPQG